MSMKGITSSEIPLVQCPSCSESTLKIDNGCHSCINEDCGFSKCDI